MENKELETWLEETKAKNLTLDELKDFMEYVPTCPHDTVWSKLKGETNEEKASILFNQWDVEKFLERRKFEFNCFKNMKPLPTETDLKSQVIELIEKRINTHIQYEEANHRGKSYLNCILWENSANEAREILKAIKQL